ncbi:hypothetical protein [Streptomyces sp. NPDC007070]|uniref:hypothetical protein n=1 Tax=Streptomyces sp. NPDC007070 TaxID=3154312 RepID=UPI0033F15F86
MQRTSIDRTRRRNIAAAAVGGIQRARVVLYACLPAQDRHRAFSHLWTYASARDWLVVAEHVDEAGTSAPVEARPGWQQIARLIEDGEAQGIVTPGRSAWGVGEPERTRLDTWLASHHVFVVDVWAAAQTLAVGT